MLICNYFNYKSNQQKYKSLKFNNLKKYYTINIRLIRNLKVIGYSVVIRF